LVQLIDSMTPQPNFKSLSSIFLLLLFIWAPLVQAQVTGKEEKLFNKSVKLYGKKKYAKAVKTITPVVEAHKDLPLLWRNYIQYCFMDYAYNGKTMSNFSISIDFDDEDELTEEEKAAKLRRLNKMFKYLMLGAEEKKLMIVCREATLYTRDLESGIPVVRRMYVDQFERVDTNVLNRAGDRYREGEEDFRRGNYNDAIKNYQAALDIEQNFYKARLYLADSYYMLKEYQRAAPIFKETIDRFPNLLEPRKMYVDALEGMHEIEKAKDASLESLLCFPDIGMISRLERYCEDLGETYNDYWMARQFRVNEIDPVDSLLGEDITDLPSYWEHYVEAMENVREISSDDGILEKNSITNYVTLEGYCWDYMLTKADADIEELKYAREMQANGTLEHYVLITLFHVDLYKQYKFFIESKPNESKLYLESLITK
jgi:tetratricopeptide (TPR) repeat protein